MGMTQASKYRVQYTSVKPGGTREREDDMVYGNLEAVRCYFDEQSIWAADPIVMIEQGMDDGPGRVVPASEWDVCE